MVMLVEEPTVTTTVTVASLVFMTTATLISLYIRSRTRLCTTNAVISMATTHTTTLQADPANQQLTDAIVAEAHGTLTHSLSLMTLDASAFKAEAVKLGDSLEAQSLADKAEDIRRQSAGALGEAHPIIDMLYNPHQAWEQLAPFSNTSLTRELLDALIANTCNSGTSLNTWIDIQQLSVTDESVGKVAYRAIQEGLMSARRHVSGTPVSLEASAMSQADVYIHISNLIATSVTETQRAHGAGLSGLAARMHPVNGRCRYGMDDRHLFHVDV